MEDLNAASLEDVKEWFRTYYGAANAVLVIAGDITAAEAKAKVEKYFGDIPSGPVIKRQEAWIAKMSGEQPRHAAGPRAAGAHLQDVEHPRLQARATSRCSTCVGDLLASGKNSRLYKRLVYTDQIATAVSAVRRSVRDRLAVAAHRDREAGRRSGARRKGARRRTGARSSRPGPTAAELERVRTASYAGFVRGVERIDGFGGKSYILAAEPGVRRLAGFLQDRGSAGSAKRDCRRTCRPPRSAGCPTACSCSNVEPTPELQDRRLQRRIAASCRPPARRRSEAAAAAAHDAVEWPARSCWPSGTTRRSSTSR